MNIHNAQNVRRKLMEIIIDFGDKEIEKAVADKLSKDTGVARDKFKESTNDVDTNLDATSD